MADAAALEEAPKGGSLGKDLFSGAVGGVAQVLIGMTSLFLLFCFDFISCLALVLVRANVIFKLCSILLF